MYIELSCEALYKSVLQAYWIKGEINSKTPFFINYIDLKNTIHKMFWH